jgi:hypothetical protein
MSLPGEHATRRQKFALDQPLNVLHDDQVLTFPEWCRINRLSERTGRRILDGPDRPTITYLSARRIGITIRNNRLWQASRERG